MEGWWWKHTLSTCGGDHHHDGARCTHCQEFFLWNAIDQQLEWSPGNYFIASPYTPTPTIAILFPAHHYSTIPLQFPTTSSTTSPECTKHNSATKAYISAPLPTQSLYIAFPSYLLERRLARITRRTLQQRHRQLPTLTPTLT